MYKYKLFEMMFACITAVEVTPYFFLQMKMFIYICQRNSEQSFFYKPVVSSANDMLVFKVRIDEPFSGLLKVLHDVEFELSYALKWN